MTSSSRSMGRAMVATGCRPGGLAVLPTEAFQDAFADAARIVPLGPGDVVLYDAATIHGSPPNPTNAVRAAVGIALVPDDAALVHVHQDAAGTGPATAYAVDAGYYLDQGLRNRPIGYPGAPLWASPVTEADLAAALDLVAP